MTIVLIPESDMAQQKNIFLKHAENANIIHLATHAFIDEENSRLSWIAFTPDSSIDDTFLRLDELYGLELNADLVVLSACNSDVGEFSRGEGIIGFTRGLLYSGAKNVLVSQ